MSHGPYARLSVSDDATVNQSTERLAYHHGTHEYDSRHGMSGAEGNGFKGGEGPLLPHVYYDEGPFDPPSSDSEEDTLLEKASGERREVSSPGAAERALGLNPELVVGLGKVMFQESYVIHANGSTQ